MDREYGYPVAQAVEGPANNSSGGMEYPMITLITSPDAKKETLDAVIVHEVGHNWFMAMLGSNERMHTWMDEGLNSYFQFRWAKRRSTGLILYSVMPYRLKSRNYRRMIFATVYNVIDKSLPMQYPMDTPADKFPNSDEYGLVSYVKTALWMYLLEASSGREKADKAIQLYFSKWKFKHPQPADMKAAFEEAVGGNLDKFFLR